MKRLFAIGLLLLLALVACHTKQDDSVETQNFASLQPVLSPELQSIDSLMWQQPDSALTLLLPWFDTVHTNETFNNHYGNLLLAELLYKNDYAQANRRELKAAVAYFDSIVQVPELVEGPSKKPKVFLCARAHYINGVGYYEQDSVVEACREYIRALETMEECDEKDLVGSKAKFMTYTYNRLIELFSAQFMMEPAIACCEQSLTYCKIAPTSPFGVSSILLHLGMQYDKLGEKEKAMEYYKQALDELPILKGTIYRDIVAGKALCDYQLGSGMELPMDALKQILAETADENERLIRYMTIGDIFFEENLYDSALYYLEPVYEHNKNVVQKIQVANFLRVIYDSLGCEDKMGECIRFLADQKKSEGQNKALVSQLEGLFQSYLNQKTEQKAAKEKREAIFRTVMILVLIAFVMATVMVLVNRKKGEKRLAKQEAEAKREMEEKDRQHKVELKRQQVETAQRIVAKDKQYEEALAAEQQAHRMEQAALSGRLKRSNEALQNVAQQRAMNLYKAEGDKAWEQILAEFETAYPHAIEKLQASHPDLTETERNIVILSFLGFRVKEEAEILDLSTNTVEKYRTNIRKKAGPDPISHLIG